MKRRIVALLLACTVSVTNMNILSSQSFMAVENSEIVQEIEEQVEETSQIVSDTEEVVETTKTESENSSEAEKEEKSEASSETEKEVISETLNEVISEVVSENVSETVEMNQQQQAMTVATSTEYEYTVESSTKKITITKYVGTESKVTIPSAIDGYKVTGIGSYAFENCESLTEIEIASSVKTIGYGAFQGCENLKSVTLNDGVETIGEYAFQNCKNLPNITITNNVENINSYAFYGCESLTEIEIPSNVEYLGNAAFENCEKLAKITLHSGLKTMGRRFLSGTQVTEIVIPKTIENMNDALSNAEKLTKVTFASGIKTIPSQALCKDYSSDVINVTEVILPTGITEIGSYAFQNCDTLTEIKLPSSIETIGYMAFNDCDGLTELTLSEELKTIGQGAFQNCRNLTGITIPKNVKTINESAFYGCESLTEMEIPSNVEYLGNYAFGNCEKLEKITLNSGLKTIGNNFLWGTQVTEIIIPKTVESMEYALSGVEGLTKVTFASGMKKIPSSAICKYYYDDEWNITEVFVPASVIEVGYNAFGDLKGTLNLASEDSGASIYAIDNEMSYIAKTTGISDKEGRYLARNKTNYTTTLSGSTTSGYVNLNLEYAFKDEAKKLVETSNMQLKIKLPSVAQLAEGTFKLNGKTYGVSMDENGYIYVPVDKMEGNAAFSVKVSNVSYLMTYAQLEYIYNGETKTETLGIVDMGQDIFTLSVPDETSSANIDVLGFANPQQEVHIYLEDKKVATVTTSKTGSYFTTIEIPNVQEGTFYKIEATTSKDGKTSSVIAYTKYTQNAVKLTECTMYYREKAYDLLTLSGQRPVITWDSYSKFTFSVAFDDNSSVDDVTIVSTKNGEVKKLKATWNEAQNAFIAAGFVNYVPGNITVEYGKSLGENFNNSKVEIGTLYEDEEKVGYESKVSLEAIPEFYFLKEIEQNISKIPEGNFEQVEYDGDIYYFLNEDKYIQKDGKAYACEELYALQEDGTYTLLRTGVGLEVEESIKKTRAMSEMETLKELKTLLDLLTDVSEDTEESELYVLLEKTITAAQKSFESSSSEYQELEMLKTELEIAKIGLDTKEAFKKINKIIENASDFSDDPDILPSDDIAEKMQETVEAMSECAQKVSNNMLRKIMEKLVERGWFEKSLIEKSMSILEKKVENGGVNFNPKYSIDPSGYIYEAVKSNRVENAITTIYYKDPETGETTLWNAEEYDQSNPLYTDKEGCYAWDVPEGLWQVKVEKEGYETTYSEWLPVPPPQLDVNLALISKEKAEIESFVAHSDYASVVFSKYMIPESVKEMKLTDANGNTITFTLEYDKESVNAEGINFAKEYILRFDNGITLEPDTNCTLSVSNTLKSYANVSMDAKTSTVQVQKNTEIIAPDEVIVKMGTVLEVPVCIVNGKDGMKLSALSSFDTIASVKEIGADKIYVSGNMYGDTEITVTIPESDVKKVIKVTVDKVSQEAEVEQTVILPQSTYTVSVGESVEIIPKVYPNASLKGKWVLNDTEGIVSVKENTFTAQKEGEVTARYIVQSENGKEIFAECKITVQSQIMLGDINGDGKVKINDMLTILHGISGSQTLSESQQLAADIDKDGKVTVRDMLRIMHYISGSSSTL